MSKYFRLLLFVVGSELVGILGSIFTISAIPTWYLYLTKPFFSPPNWVFGPVWTILYAMIGISAFLIYESKKNNRKALKVFAIQMALNFIWTPMFFGLKDLSLAFVVIIAMWYYIFLTIKEFAKINKTASYLLYPYLAWVSFASLLNFSIWILNT